MKFGVNTFLWAAQFGPKHFELIPLIKEWGFDGIEIPVINPRDVEASRLRRELEKAQLQCTVCSVLPEGLSAVARSNEVRKKTCTHLTECIRVAAECGAKLIAGPLYCNVGSFTGERRTEEEWAAAVECYSKLAPTLDRYEVDLAIEPLNRFETYFLNTAEDASALTAAVGHTRIGVLFDTFHANIEEKDISLALEACGPKLKHFHASENDRGIPGSGHVTWASIFLTLRELGYEGWVTIESFGFRLGELSTAASIWRDLASSSDAIASEGLEFLQTLACSLGAVT